MTCVGCWRCVSTVGWHCVSACVMLASLVLFPSPLFPSPLLPRLFPSPPLPTSCCIHAVLLISAFSRWLCFHPTWEITKRVHKSLKMLVVCYIFPLHPVVAPECVPPLLQLGNYSAENQLLKYSAKDYYFKAVICHFALMGAERASVSEADVDTTHTRTRAHTHIMLSMLYTTVYPYHSRKQ